MTGAERVVADLGRLKKVSDTEIGVTRLAYTSTDNRARSWFVDECRGLGMTIEVDTVGNTFGWAKGAVGNRRILMGSHLDSVMGGGAYDGTVGVAVGLEVARRLLANDPKLPIGVASFACEESTRFGMGCIGSRFLMGLLDLDDLDKIVDNEGLTALHAVSAANLSGKKLEVNDDFIGAYVEVHIDQGTLLTSMGRHVGIVDAIAGVERISIEWVGESSHSGGRRRFERKDALLAAAHFVTEADTIWQEIELAKTDASVAVTVGKLDVEPNGPNTVAGRVHLIADVRSSDKELLAKTSKRLIRVADEIAQSHRLDVRVKSLGRLQPVSMDAQLISVLEETSGNLGINSGRAPSLSGHDAMILGRRFPVALLLLANPSGISHAPDEAVDETALAQVSDLLEAAIPEMLDLSSVAQPI